MHRHGYKGRKFGRETDQRTSLIKSLAEALIAHKSIETTLPKAKELVSYTERLITKAKTGTLHNRRQIVSALFTVGAANKLVDSIAPQLKRTSGYLRIEKSTTRRGDNTQLARVSFVDELKIMEAPLKKIKKAAQKSHPKSPNSDPSQKVKKSNAKLQPKVDSPSKKQVPKSVGSNRQSVRHTRSGAR